ncbi:putative E3 ubiquitin-protein ligase RHA2A-like [Capsicum annuum]|nr:putative E3 ubiquitin-protein ligase RHA2A-like [Capsicum annuum]
MKDSISDEREELMVSPLGGIPQLRKAHFLEPIVSSSEGPNLKLPSLPFSSESEWPFKVSFNGCRHRQNKWKQWVETMESLYHSVWEAAGIYEAIKGSVYKVHNHKDLIFGLVERWCCETNTFIFPWGEATVTLEDMMILGGFSVLGDFVLFPLQSPEMVQIEENLEKARGDLIRLKADDHTRWLNLFMNSGKDFEHEAFLSLWLSRFVFPGNEYDKIGKHVFPIAVNLARGTRLALAPAVLASIYRDLSLLKQTMIMTSSNEPSSNGNDGGRFNILKFNLWAPLFLVQVWAWERLLLLRPEQVQNYNMLSGVRMERWHNVKQTDVINVRTVIDSSGETFQWRPYALAVEGWVIPKFYKEKEEWAIVEGQSLDQKLESFVRCLRVSELVGFDCQEPYRPNRVAMQFGYDQNFPKWIPRSPSSPELAWYNYCRPFGFDLRLYYPSRLSESDVTTQYLKWWRKAVLVLADAFKGLSQRQRSTRRLKRFSNVYDSHFFSPKLKQVKVKVETDMDVYDVLQSLHIECQQKQVENYPDVPPGFPPKSGGKYDKKNLSMVVSQTMVCDIVPPGFVVNHIADEKVDTSTDYADDKKETGSVVPSKSGGENDTKNLSIGVSQIMACQIVPPGSVQKHIAEERVYTSTDYAHDSNESTSVVLPKCNGKNDNENLSMGVCQNVARHVVPLGLTEKCNAGKSFYTSTDAHESNESSSVLSLKCIGINDKENLSMEVCLTAACDIVPTGSTEKHTDCEHDRNENNRNIAQSLVINGQKRGERSSCDDLVMVIEFRLSRLERQAASRKRC